MSFDVILDITAFGIQSTYVLHYRCGHIVDDADDGRGTK
jgi:hypothetical protein